jgi:hypothetical protein
MSPKMVDDGSDDSQAVPERGGAAVTNIRKLYERREANAVWGSTEHHQLRRARIEAARVEPGPCRRGRRRDELLFGSLAWAALYAAGVPRRRIRLSTDQPMNALYESLGAAGDAPRDESHNFAVSAIVLVLVAAVVVPLAIWLRSASTELVRPPDTVPGHEQPVEALCHRA